MKGADDYFFNGLTQIRAPGSHPGDARGYAAAQANGVTKREMFAAMAMQGLLAANYDLDVPAQAVLVADVLIKELEKETK